jgi:hypothetical protein
LQEIPKSYEDTKEELKRNIELFPKYKMEKLYNEMVKKGSEYSCKIYENVHVCGCLFNGKQPFNFVIPEINFNKINTEKYFKIATVVIIILN